MISWLFISPDFQKETLALEDSIDHSKAALFIPSGRLEQG